MKSESRKKYGLKQMNIEIPESVLSEIRACAAKRNIPMRTWILRQIARGLQRERI